MQLVERYAAIVALGTAILSHVWFGNLYSCLAFLGALVCVVFSRFLSESRVAKIGQIEVAIMDLEEQASVISEQLAKLPALEAKLAEQDAGIAKALDGIKAAVGMRQMMSGGM